MKAKCKSTIISTICLLLAVLVLGQATSDAGVIGGSNASFDPAPSTALASGSSAPSLQLDGSSNPGDMRLGEPLGPSFLLPQATINWKVRPKFVSRLDRYELTPTRADIHSTNYTLELDACESRVAGRQTYEGDSRRRFVWTIGSGGTTDLQITHSCVIPVEVSSQDVRLSLTVLQDEQYTDTEVEYLEIEDLLVVVLGDSVASGEGTPDDNFNGSTTHGIWYDSVCHRSQYAAGAQSAIDLERASDQSVVTFVSLACTGARLQEGLLEPQPVDPAFAYGTEPREWYWHELEPEINPFNSDDCDKDFLGQCLPNTDPWPEQGTRPAGEWRLRYVPTAPQLDQLDALLCPPGETCSSRTQRRDIDALILSAGANDLSFSAIIRICAQPDLHLPDDLHCDHEENARLWESIIGHSLNTLDGSYETVASRLRNGHNIGETLLIQAPDMIRDASGNVCAMALFEDAVLHADVNVVKEWIAGDDGEFSRDELNWANRTVYEPLIAAQTRAVARHGWTLVETPEFSTAGYCHPAYQRMVTTYTDSRRVQGDNNGTFHPNWAGQQEIAEDITREISYLVN